MAQLQAAGEGIAIVEPPGAEAAQRLRAADLAVASADIAERPERHVVRRRQIARATCATRIVFSATGRIPPIAAHFAVHGIVQQTIAAGQPAVGNQLHAPAGHRQIIAGVIYEGQAIQQLLVGAQELESVSIDGTLSKVPGAHRRPASARYRAAARRESDSGPPGPRPVPADSCSS